MLDDGYRCYVSTLLALILGHGADGFQYRERAKSSLRGLSVVLANGQIWYNTIALPIPTFNHYGKFGKFGISDFGTFVLPDPEHSSEEALLSYHPSHRYLPPLPLLQNTELKSPITVTNKFTVSTHLLYIRRQGIHQRYTISKCLS